MSALGRFHCKTITDKNVHVNVSRKMTNYELTECIVVVLTTTIIIIKILMITTTTIINTNNIHANHINKNIILTILTILSELWEC